LYGFKLKEVCFLSKLPYYLCHSPPLPGSLCHSPPLPPTLTLALQDHGEKASSIPISQVQTLGTLDTWTIYGGKGSRKTALMTKIKLENQPEVPHHLTILVCLSFSFFFF
jgi:hypothetical protein